MDARFISAMSQWAMYFLPSIVAWIRLRMGKTVPLSMGFFILVNLLLAWTVVVWIMLMLNAFGYNPVAWVVLKLARFLPATGAAPMTAPQAPGAPSWQQGQVCGQCGGSGSVTCSHCQGRGSWYTQPTTAHEVSQLQSCSYCMSSGRIRCPYCGGVRV